MPSRQINVSQHSQQKSFELVTRPGTFPGLPESGHLLGVGQRRAKVSFPTHHRSLHLPPTELRRSCGSRECSHHRGQPFPNEHAGVFRKRRGSRQGNIHQQVIRCLLHVSVKSSFNAQYFSYAERNVLFKFFLPAACGMVIQNLISC